MFDAICEKVDEKTYKIIKNDDIFKIDYIICYEDRFQLVRVGVEKEILSWYKENCKIKSITKIN